MNGFLAIAHLKNNSGSYDNVPLFSSWQYETEDDWRRNAEMLAEFTEVKPLICKCASCTA